MQLDVLVSLVEKDQVAMSGGGGFKQGEGLGGVFGMASFSHRNLFGHGQRFSGSAEVGPVSSACCFSLFSLHPASRLPCD